MKDLHALHGPVDVPLNLRDYAGVVHVPVLWQRVSWVPACVVHETIPGDSFYRYMDDALMFMSVTCVRCVVGTMLKGHWE